MSNAAKRTDAEGAIEGKPTQDWIYRFDDDGAGPWFKAGLRCEATRASGAKVAILHVAEARITGPSSLTSLGEYRDRDNVNAELFGGADGIYSAPIRPPEQRPDRGALHVLAQRLYGTHESAYYGPDRSIADHLPVAYAKAKGIPTLAEIEGGRDPVVSTDVEAIERKFATWLRRSYAWTGRDLAKGAMEPHWNVLVYAKGDVALVCGVSWPVDPNGTWTAGASFRLDDGARAEALAIQFAGRVPGARLLRRGRGRIVSSAGLRHDPSVFTAGGRRSLLAYGLRAALPHLPEALHPRIAAFTAIKVKSPEDAEGAAVWWREWDRLRPLLGPHLGGDEEPIHRLALQVELLDVVARDGVVPGATPADLMRNRVYGTLDAIAACLGDGAGEDYRERLARCREAVSSLGTPEGSRRLWEAATDLWRAVPDAFPNEAAAGRWGALARPALREIVRDLGTAIGEGASYARIASTEAPVPSSAAPPAGERRKPSKLGQRLIAEIAGEPAMRKTDVAKRLDVNRGVANRIVDTLVADGWMVAEGGGLFRVVG